MKVLSLFDGMGGAHQALRNLNIPHYYFSSEIDKYANVVHSYNYSKYGKFNNSIKLISNTQRYKMLGNAFTVPVIEHILKHI